MGLRRVPILQTRDLINGRTQIWNQKIGRGSGGGYEGSNNNSSSNSDTHDAAAPARVAATDEPGSEPSPV